MTGDGTDGTGSQLTRREVLATVSAGGMAGLAGCSSLQNECKLEVNKSVDGEFHYGQTGTYVFEVCSLEEGWFFGQEDCTETITIVDDLPDGISFDSVSSPDWTATTGGGVVELENDSYGTLDTGDCLTFEMDVTVDSAGAFPGSPPHEVENCAQLQYDGEDYRPIGDNCVTHDITHDDSGECRLSLSKDTLGPFNYGQQATYVFDVCNDGDGECTGPLTIRDDLPNGISFDSVGGSNWTASTGGGIVELENDSYGSLAPGACLTVEMTVSVAPAGEVPEEVENCGRLHHDGQVVAEDCVGHDITHDDCNLSFSKETDGEFHYGQQGTYVVTVCNEGEEVCTGPLTVEDELPDGITFASIVGSDWTGTAAGGVVEVTSTTGGLAPGACTDFEMTVDVAPADDFPGDPPGEVTNCAELFHDGAVVGEDCVTHQVTEHPCELTLDKRVGWEFHYGQLASYVFEVCNDSEVACTGELAIEDDLPDGISVASVDSGWTTTASGGVVELANDTASLAPGECLTVEMTVEVAPAADFPGDPTHSVTNCADLFHAGTFKTEDCTTTRITRPDGCPPVEFDLNTGYDQAAGGEIDPGDTDDDWDVVADPVSSGPVPRDADVFSDARFPAPFDDSNWISFDPDAGEGLVSDADEAFEYEYCFCLNEGFQEPELSLRARADDEITDVQLNGTSLSYSGDGSHTSDPIEETYTDPALFQAGDNCLTITVADNEGVVSGLNLAGRARALNADCDCEAQEPCDLSLSKETKGQFHYGEQGTYAFQVCNDQDEECTGPLTIEDALHDGFTFVDVSGDWTATTGGGVVELTNDTYGGLAPGECLTFEMTVDVAAVDEFPGGSDSVINCAELFHDGAFVTEDCVRHGITEGGEDCTLSIEKTTGGEFHYGQQGTYAFEVCSDPDLNDEECTAPLTIEDDLPDGISFVSVSGNWTASVSGGVVEATNDSYGGLAPGECLDMKMTVQVADEDEFSGDPDATQNCGILRYDGDVTTEDCVTHSVSRGDE